MPPLDASQLSQLAAQKLGGIARVSQAHVASPPPPSPPSPPCPVDKIGTMCAKRAKLGKRQTQRQRLRAFLETPPISVPYARHSEIASLPRHHHVT
jgi:hypothetical protein